MTKRGENIKLNIVSLLHGKVCLSSVEETEPRLQCFPENDKDATEVIK